MTRPEWSRWSKSKTAHLWEWLALSVDVEPRTLSVDHFLVLQSATSAMPLDKPDDPAWLRQMCVRLAMLAQRESTTDAGASAAQAAASLAINTPLSRKNFIDHVQGCHWRLPARWRPALPELSDPQRADPSDPSHKSGKEVPCEEAAPAAAVVPEHSLDVGVYRRIISHILEHAGYQTKNAAFKYLKPILKAHKVKLTDKRLRAAMALVGEDDAAKAGGHQLIDAATCERVIRVLLKDTGFPVKGRSKAFLGLVGELSEQQLIASGAELERLLQDCCNSADQA